MPPKDIAEIKWLITSGSVDFSVKLRRVLEFALENPADAAFANTRGLALRCGVSVNTVLKLVKVPGFDRFRQFRDLFRAEICRSTNR